MTGQTPDSHDGDQAGPRATWSDLVSVLAPTGLLTGLLYYFGYVSARAFYAYFGVPLSILDLSTADFLFRSADTIFRPLATLVFAALVLYAVYLWFPFLLRRIGTRASGILAMSCGVLGLASATLGLLGLYVGGTGLAAPLALAAAALLVELACWTAMGYASFPAAVTTPLARGQQLRRGLLIALVTVASFWGVSIFATQRGAFTARVVEETLPVQAKAVVYSDRDLRLQGPGVQMSAVRTSAFRFRYVGLRPLRHADGRWFLLPAGWTRAATSVVIALDDEPGHVRVDLAP